MHPISWEKNMTNVFYWEQTDIIYNQYKIFHELTTITFWLFCLITLILPIFIVREMLSAFDVCCIYWNVFQTNFIMAARSWASCLITVHIVSLRIFLFVWFDSLRPINNLSVIKWQVLLGWTSTKLGLMFLLEDTRQWRQWGSNQQPLGLESSTLQLSHCVYWNALQTSFIMVANSMDPDQTAPKGAVWSGSILFVIRLLKQTTFIMYCRKRVHSFLSHLYCSYKHLKLVNKI